MNGATSPEPKGKASAKQNTKKAIPERESVRRARVSLFNTNRHHATHARPKTQTVKMSLHIGNLSSRIHRDELERVFQRFGRCNVRIKDGYGFVVYEFPPNAEKALKALHKRNICGEPLALSWSNKQPRPFKRWARTARAYERRHGSDSGRGGDYVGRKLGSNYQQEYRTNITQPDRNDGQLSTADMHEESILNHQDNIKDYTNREHQGYGEDLLGRGDRIEPDPVDNDRWGEQFSDPTNEVNEVDAEHGVEFDRYDPCEHYDGRDDDENLQKAYSGGTLAVRSSQEVLEGDHADKVTLNCPNDANSLGTCYRCGISGHKMRSCPQKRASWRKLSRFDHRHSDEIHRSGGGKGELEKIGSRSWEKIRSSREGRRLKNDKESSGLGRHDGSTKSGRSVMEKETHWPRKKDYEGKKRSRKESGSPERYGSKRGRNLISSPLHIDYAASGLHSTSHSSKYLQRSHSRSGSKSASSSLRSGSTSLYSKSKSSKTKSRSSSHTSLSLSVSLGRPLRSSSNKAQLNVKGSSDNATTPELKEVLIEEVHAVAGDAGLQEDKHVKKMVAMNNDNSVLSLIADDEVENDQPLLEDNDDCAMLSNSLHNVTDPSTLILSEKEPPAPGNFSLVPALETECQNSVTSMMVQAQVPMEKCDSKASACSCSGHSRTITAEELSMILKHYRLDCQNENEKPLPAEAYFGSARMWPWEIVYYRRLKKGPISVENYARRVDQNKEFGITDKYIRSSSGWGELHQESP